MPSAPISRAQALIEALRQRSTPARALVLDLLLDSRTALAHPEIAAAAQAAGVELDRVTLYRVLDWLVEQGLAHKVLGEDRTWRFNAVASRAAPHEHAHFHCDRCGRLYCLEQLQPALGLNLPPGFQCRHVEVTLRGICPECRETD